MNIELALKPCNTRRTIAGQPDVEEAGWVARAQQGDQEAFRRLLERYRGRAVRLAASILRRPEEADDAAQDAFILAFRNIHRFRSQGCFYTWLYRIVLRTCLDRMRRKDWNLSCNSLEACLQTPAPGQAEEAVENRLLVEALLDRLSPPLRAALVLREVEGLEYEEIATVLGIRVGTVRSRLHSARVRFRDMWNAAAREGQNG